MFPRRRQNTTNSNYTANGSHGSNLHRRSASGGSGNGSSPASSSALYQPSIFRYTCRGRLRLDNRVPQNGENNSSTSNGSHSIGRAGQCHGMQSQLELMDHWNKPCSREEAIHWFQIKSAAANMGDHADASATAVPHSSGDGHASPTSSDSPAATAHAPLQPIYISNVLIYPNIPTSKSQENEDDKENNHKKKTTTTISNDVPLTKEEWSCYGSTEVDLLVLRKLHSKQESIVAVSPYCAPGTTIRDVTLPSTANDSRGESQQDRTTTIRLGFLEILYQSSFTVDDEEDESDMEQCQSSSSSTTTDNKDKSTTTKSTSTNIRRASSSANSKKNSFWNRFQHTSSNVLQHMIWNATWISQSITQDDFPNRTFAAGQRILGETTKTAERTVKLMKKVFLWPHNSSNNNDNDDHDGRK